jgi:hypothetical protein
MKKAPLAIWFFVFAAAAPGGASPARATTVLVSENIECQAAREKAASAVRIAIAEAESPSTCLRRNELSDGCSPRFRAVNASKNSVEQTASQVGSICR